MELTYSKCGDYLLPNITLLDLAPDGLAPDAPPLGKYGRIHKAFLKEHKSALYSQLLLSERLYPLCRAVDEAAANGSRQSATLKSPARLFSRNWSTTKIIAQN